MMTLQWIIKRVNEDIQVSKWIYHSDKLEHFISEDYQIYDAPDYTGGWGHPFTNGTIAVHQLKSDVSLLRTCLHFK